MKLRVTAPSNIAVVKYMGKDDPSQNLPSNPSLSMTLSSLCSIAEVEISAAKSFSCELGPEAPAGSFSRELLVPDLSEKARTRMLDHSKRVAADSAKVLAAHGLRHSSKVALQFRVANTFPAGAGIASSASSFAAVTLATVGACADDTDAFAKRFQESESLKQDIAELSRKGSGSSCRSFEGPWVAWHELRAQAVAMPKLPELTDLVVIVDAASKAVGSSEAHLRIKTSPLWIGRQERTQKRCFLLSEAIQQGHLPSVAEIAWQEAWEMHSLFHTSQPPFTYWKPKTLEVLQWIEPFARASAGPSTPWIVTLDAGPNIHCLVPSSIAAQAKAQIQQQFPDLPILEDSQGRGLKLNAFECRVPGKFVLAGEHAVLRGYPSLALPHPEFGLTLTFRPGTGPLSVSPSGFEEPVAKILEQFESKPTTGELNFQSSVPMGAGLGSSAALCVAVVRWLNPGASPEAVVRQATELENIFHGRSSGMDVATVASGQAIKFYRGQPPQLLTLPALPKFTFVDTGLRKKTREMVQKVEALGDATAAIDRKMGDVTELAIQGLETYAYGRKRQGLELLAQAMQEGMGCFEAWGLIPDEVRPLIQKAYDEGALAVKMTGAGGGGYLVALWGDSN